MPPPSRYHYLNHCGERQPSPVRTPTIVPSFHPIALIPTIPPRHMKGDAAILWWDERTRYRLLTRAPYTRQEETRHNTRNMKKRHDSYIYWYTENSDTHFLDTVWRIPRAPCCKGCSRDVPSPLLSIADASSSRQDLHALHSCSSTLSSSFTCYA